MLALTQTFWAEYSQRLMKPNCKVLRTLLSPSWHGQSVLKAKHKQVNSNTSLTCWYNILLGRKLGDNDKVEYSTCFPVAICTALCLMSLPHVFWTMSGWFVCLVKLQCVSLIQTSFSSEVLLNPLQISRPITASCSQPRLLHLQIDYASASHCQKI